MRIYKSTAIIIGMAMMTLTSCNNGQGEYLVNVNGQNVMLKGYDVVAYFTENQPVIGLPEFSSDYDHATYYFSSQENKELFDGNVAKYAPQYGGFCAVAAANNKVEEVEVDKFAILNGKLYLQRNAKAVAMWEADPQGTVDQADKNWPGLVKKYGKSDSSK